MNVVVKAGTEVPDAFLNDVLSGLSRPQKAIPPHWLYDQTGSELFEQITQLPEYYVTRVEVALLEKTVAALVSDIGRGATVVEYGAGAAVKVSLLLDALEKPSAYVAIDISYGHLLEAVRGIATDYPDLSVSPVEGDFLAGAVAAELPDGGPRVGFFPGSTIGNLSDQQIHRFLTRAGSLLGHESWLLLGADLRKSSDILIPAYDDSADVTARFNKNLITRINRELSGTINIDQFAHRAIWRDDLSRIEMHLESLSDQEFSVAGQPYAMARGETIHTENSRKFTRTALQGLADRAGWRISKYVTDRQEYFALLLLTRS
ncbi:MAG: L-histidine N(alpha)-methyltransferase [Hyphomicrobiales bacterium]|nr:L-histidine N(alpha)-methyltransferase [Hyphomicrobiales bacterium]